MKSYSSFFAALMLLVSCSGSINLTGSLDQDPDIYPDYSGVTIPCNIAPLNFRLNDGADWEARGVILSAGRLQFQVLGDEFDIPQDKWAELLSLGSDITATVAVKKDGKWLGMNPFVIHVSKDEIDSHISYRLIDPGYETWNRMGLYQRCLQDFTQTAIVTNEDTDRNCMNCHSFCGRDPGKMVFHMRGKNGGTYLVNDGKLEKLNTKTPQTISALVYPQWHPSGDYIAFSVNDIAQVFHSTNRNRIEVFDFAADLVVYDVRTHEVVPVPGLMQPDRMETYPSFSADGRKLYFCLSPQPEMPEGYRDVRYSICAIDFDPETCTFGNTVETIYDAVATGRNAVFPRVSPDGRFLMYSESDYGCFTIWHKEADLRMLDLATGQDVDLSALNSDDVDSYHSWSSNSRWVVFSSRRMDGLYTRPFIAHIDENGVASKPFVLPQKSTYFYDQSLKSFNIPEFTCGQVPVSEQEFVQKALNDKGIDVTFRQ